MNTDFGPAGIVALVLLFLLSAGLQDPPEGMGQERAPGEFQGCYTGSWCYWSNLPPVLLHDAKAPDPFERMYGVDARNAAEHMIETAEAVRVVKVCEGPRRRIVAKVYVDGVNLSTWLKRHGYADRRERPVCRDRP